MTDKGFADGAVNVGNSFLNAFAHIAGRIIIAELECFIFACGCARRDGCTAHYAAFEDYVYFYCGIATRIKDFASDYFLNSHCFDIFYILKFGFSCFLSIFGADKDY